MHLIKSDIMMIILLLLLLKIRDTSADCCSPFWTVEPEVVVSDFPMYYRDCTSGVCFYESCGQSGWINGYFFNHSIPIDYSVVDEKFLSTSFFIRNRYCGKGTCNLFGCFCEDGCQTGITKNPYVDCTFSFDGTSCTYKASEDDRCQLADN